MKIPTYEAILPYIDAGLISEQSHPDDPAVRIFNYTQKCQYAGAWDPVTMACRGLILNVQNGEIIARPFGKFFNYQEHLEKGLPIPANEPFTIHEKLDGSLGILYELHGKPWIATRGSFQSEQALWATTWWREHVGIMPQAPNETALFEIIVPWNRIVVKYDFEGLVYLTTIDKETGRTVMDGHMEKTVELLPGILRRAKRFGVMESVRHKEILERFANTKEENFEGYVFHFPASDLRMKLKLEEYVRLHRILTGVSEKTIWELLRDGKTTDGLLENVPEEFIDWIQKVEETLQARFVTLSYQAETDAFEAEQACSPLDRKALANYVLQHSANPGLAFAALDKKDYSEKIWRMLKPKGQSGFRADIDA